MMFKVNQASKEKKIVGNMKGEGPDGELEMLLNEIHLHQSYQTSSNQNHLSMGVSPINSSSFSGGFGSSGSSSPFLGHFDGTMYRTPPSTRYSDSSLVAKSNSNEHMLDDIGLSETIYRMHIGDGYEFSEGFQNGSTVENYYPIGGFNRDHGGFQSPVWEHTKSYDYNMKATLYSDPSFHKDPIDYLAQLKKDRGRGYFNGEIQLPNPSMSKPYHSRRCVIDSNANRSILKPLHSSQLMIPKLDLSLENPSYNHSVLKQTRAISNGKVYPSLLSMTDAGDLEAFNREGSFIIQGKSLKYVVNKGCDRSKARKKDSGSEISMQNRKERKIEVDNRIYPGGICEKPLQMKYSSLGEVQGFIYFLAKDQQGCRFLQKIFDVGTHQDVQIIFNEIIDGVVELMMNPFGNYLIQKLLDICSEEQRMQIVLMVTEEPEGLVRICLNTHGTRVMQKLIETLKTRQQILLLTMALEPGFLDLIKDLNGNHVVQHCLQCLGKEHNKFIFIAAAKFCVNIATHRHGCCVLNRCIAYSSGEHRDKLVAEISANGFLLAQDAFGNYVVQYIIELKIPSVAATLLSQFEGHYVYLSMQKFSSHVVEKCLRFFEDSRSRIILELLSVPSFDQLLQDPFANYVIQSALQVTKGPLHASLVQTIQPHMILRTSPYCKKLFSRNLLKK